MQHLINEVAQRTGIPEDKARVAVDTVVGYLKQHLPGGLTSQLDSVVSGSSQDEGASGSIADAARGIMGGAPR
jgi:hypothetical protein